MTKKLCACGCGSPVTRKYKPGHNSRGTKSKRKFMPKEMMWRHQ